VRFVEHAKYVATRIFSFDVCQLRRASKIGGALSAAFCAGGAVEGAGTAQKFPTVPHVAPAAVEAATSSVGIYRQAVAFSAA